MIKDINNINIWKVSENRHDAKETFLNTDITELNLGVRSFNCLKRAGCSTVGDVIRCMGENGLGLRQIRNLGTRSETEIIEKLQAHRKQCAKVGQVDTLMWKCYDWS